MAQVKPQSKEILLALSLQLRELMNLLEKKRMLLEHTSSLVMTQMDLPEKQGPAEHCSAPGWTGLPRYGYRSTCTLKVLITVTQTETRRLNMTVQC